MLGNSLTASRLLRPIPPVWEDMLDSTLNRPVELEKPKNVSGQRLHGAACHGSLALQPERQQKLSKKDIVK